MPRVKSRLSCSYTIDFRGHNITLHVEALVTIVFETLLLPGEILWVHKDVPPREWDGRTWAPGLEQLTFPGLLDLYRLYVPTDNALGGTGAFNWVRLADRMRYVWPMFRGRQDGPSNNCDPFSRAQVAQIWRASNLKESEICLPFDVARCCNA